MLYKRRIVCFVFYVILGLVLLTLGAVKIFDSFWIGMGSALIIVGFLRLIRMYKFYKNDEYREKVETTNNDERLRFIRNKAWAWTGSLFVLISAICTIVFKIIGEDLLSQFSSYALCLVLVIFWITYLFLSKKY